MTPVYLSQLQLQSALGGTLAQAASGYIQGKLPGLTSDNAALPGGYFAVDAPQQHLHSRLQQLLQSTLDAAGLNAADCLLLVASTALDVSLMEQRLAQGEALSMVKLPAFDDFAASISAEFNFAAIRIINTACTSAANALLYGQRMLQAGLYQRVLVLAFEPPGNITRTGFSALELTSHSGQYRPFHPQRDGLILGEAYATAILSSTADKAPQAVLLGGYSACDTHNITTTAEDGSHIAAVMQQALQQTALQSSDVSLLKLHGTATAANDSAEHNGVMRLFSQPLPALTVLKPYLGHTLGACGLSELALLFAGLQQGPLPALPYATAASLPFSSAPQHIAAQAVIMANFFGFGGNNASLLLRSC